jgi:hypothetical protein
MERPVASILHVLEGLHLPVRNLAVYTGFL